MFQTKTLVFVFLLVVCFTKTLSIEKKTDITGKQQNDLVAKNTENMDTVKVIHNLSGSLINIDISKIQEKETDFLKLQTNEKPKQKDNKKKKKKKMKKKKKNETKTIKNSKKKTNEKNWDQLTTQEKEFFINKRKKEFQDSFDRTFGKRN
ncbi:hypothetical protein M0813_05335 [Anaeramoeba flamelloides]|uniref:Uncharacterized protein n=1 Tax=Anaeramoeba flamelloides TaxID=1746091 RepID=A0ABQ8XH50_9EUKA|nr:hypothetical protein M0813_05335 [Anaeramoeba flamelloides]